MPINKSKYKGGVLWDHDEDRGVTFWWHWDPATRKGHIEEVWDNSRVLRHMERFRQMERDLGGQTGDLRYLGSVSLGVVQDWLNSGKVASGKDGILRVRDQKFVMKKLRDPKYSKVRSEEKI